MPLLYGRSLSIARGIMRISPFDNVKIALPCSLLTEDTLICEDSPVVFCCMVILCGGLQASRA